LRFKHWVVLALALAIGAGLWWVLLRSAPPEVPFARVKTGALRSIVSTNGQAEPLSSAEIRAEASGRVSVVLSSQGDAVKQGTVLVRLDDAGGAERMREAEAALAAARVRVEDAKRSGSTALRRKEIEGQLEEARLRVRNAQRDVGALKRLVSASAATPQEVEAAERQLSQETATEKALSAQLAALGSPTELADAHREEASAAARVAQAQRDRRTSAIVSPIAGLLYDFAVKTGGWIQAGDLVGRVGDISSVRVRLFVDEPELGRVREGMPVSIEWDARPDSKWTGVVERLPAQIQAFGTRQVGEVLSRIDNPDGDLLPGANVNAEIVSAERTNALILPKQAIRRRIGEEGVWKLVGGSLQWQPVKTGISSVTEIEILGGLQADDSVALLVDRELSEGMEVKPVYAP